MPFVIVPLDSLDDNFTILLGKNILLKITENVKARTLLDDSLVQKIVSTPNLCNEKTIKMIDELRQLDASGEDLYTSTFYPPTATNWESPRDIEARTKILTARISELMNESTTWKFALNYDKVLGAFVSERTLDEWEKREKALLATDEQLKSISGLELLEPTVAILCPTCKRTLQVGEFKGALNCARCKKDMSRKDVERVPIHRIAESVKRLWVKDFWFEAYMAKLFEKLGWTTWTAVHIMGSSGVPHEIDVLARKESNVVVVECKTGEVSRNHVFTFLTKTQDLKVNLGILALMRARPEPETRSFAKRSRLLVTLENMSKMDEKQILESLKNELPA